MGPGEAPARRALKLYMGEEAGERRAAARLPEVVLSHDRLAGFIPVTYRCLCERVLAVSRVSHPSSPPLPRTCGCGTTMQVSRALRVAASVATRANEELVGKASPNLQKVRAPHRLAACAEAVRPCPLTWHTQTEGWLEGLTPAPSAAGCAAFCAAPRRTDTPLGAVYTPAPPILTHPTRAHTPTTAPPCTDLEVLPVHAQPAHPAAGAL